MGERKQNALTTKFDRKSKLEFHRVTAMVLFAKNMLRRIDIQRNLQ